MKGQAGHPLEHTLKEFEVKLSRRNLLSLLHKLDWEDSERTLQKHLYPSGILLTVIAEGDDEHYGDNEAGTMHDETERFIEEYTDTQRQTQEQDESNEAVRYVAGLLERWEPKI
jgi:hypothetical protein